MNKLSYLWRLLATGFAFSLFGIGGLVLPLLAAILLYCWPQNKNKRYKRARYFVHLIFKLFTHLLILLRIISLSVENKAYLDRDGLLIVANHPSLIDVVILIGLVPNADCVIKQSLLLNPTMRWFLIMTGYIVNDGGKALVDSAVKSLGVGGNLIIFPEGTRSVNEVGRFQKGCANIALSANCPITPVVINCKPAMLQKHKSWYQIPSQTGRFSIKVQADIQTDIYQTELRSVAVRRLNRDLKTYFSENWKTYEDRDIELRDQAVNH